RGFRRWSLFGRRPSGRFWRPNGVVAEAGVGTEVRAGANSAGSASAFSSHRTVRLHGDTGRARSAQGSRPSHDRGTALDDQASYYISKIELQRGKAPTM